LHCKFELAIDYQTNIAIKYIFINNEALDYLFRHIGLSQAAQKYGHFSVQIEDSIRNHNDDTMDTSFRQVRPNRLGLPDLQFCR
jgi:hypothetical protein